jgi:hypothetical protein
MVIRELTAADVGDGVLLDLIRSRVSRMRLARRSGGSGPRSSDSSTHARTVAVTRYSLGLAAPSW